MSEMTKADASFNPILAEPAHQITISKLDGMNFMEWSQYVKISLKSKGKLKYVSEAPPNVKDPKFETWDTENYMVMSWLLNSMKPQIKKTYILLPTAKEIWDAVNKTYSKVGFGTQIFQIKRQIYITKQGSMNVTDYYNTLKGLLTELDLYQNVELQLMF